MGHPLLPKGVSGQAGHHHRLADVTAEEGHHIPAAGGSLGHFDSAFVRRRTAGHLEVHLGEPLRGEAHQPGGQPVDQAGLEAGGGMDERVGLLLDRRNDGRMAVAEAQVERGGGAVNVRTPVFAEEVDALPSRDPLFGHRVINGTWIISLHKRLIRNGSPRMSYRPRWPEQAHHLASLDGETGRPCFCRPPEGHGKYVSGARSKSHVRTREFMQLLPRRPGNLHICDRCGRSDRRGG